MEENNRVHRHSKVITGFKTLDGTIHWRYSTINLHPDEDENIEVRFSVTQRNVPAPQEKEAIRTVLKQMEATTVPWLLPGRRDWIFDLDRMRSEFEGLKEWE
jgi:hypothetical protein